MVLIRQRAASVLWVPTLLTPRTEPLGHGGGPTSDSKEAAENVSALARGLRNAESALRE